MHLMNNPSYKKRIVSFHIIKYPMGHKPFFQTVFNDLGEIARKKLN